MLLLQTFWVFPAHGQLNTNDGNDDDNEGDNGIRRLVSNKDVTCIPSL